MIILAGLAFLLLVVLPIALFIMFVGDVYDHQ